MRRFATLFAAFALVGVLAALPVFAFRGESKSTDKAKVSSGVGKTIQSFTLDDQNGKSIAFADLAKKKAVVLIVLGTECPLNNQYQLTLSNLYKEYSEKDVAFVGINSNVHDTPARILAHVKTHKIPFAVLKDTANVVADQLGAKRTPEAFVLSPKGKVLYQGRIDDQFGIGYKRKEPTRRDLAVALDEVLAGKDVSKSYVEAPGCLIARAIEPKKTGKYTFTKDIAPILQKRCQECHRAGQVGPMPLVTYKDALAWSEMLDEVVSNKSMPPWHADPKHGKFLNDRSMPDEERQMLLTWVKEGCPKGDDKDLPAEKSWAKGWMIGKPDVVFEMPKSFTVPKDAGARGVPYKYFMVETKFDEDRWIQAAEARPGAREVVHHILVYVVPKDQLGKGKGIGGGGRGVLSGGDGIGNGLLVAFAPGDLPMKVPAGYAKKLPKGAVLVFQMHYTPDGVEREDRSSVGLVFAKEAPKYEVRSRAVANPLFLIPAGAKAHEVRSTSRFPQEIELLSLLPHMHVRGKAFEYVVTYPNGKKETLLSVPKYDFNWQTNYHLTKPMKLPAGSRIDCTAHFDNSAENLNNPDPKKAVTWGDQTWQEMMIGFVDYALVRETKEK